MGRKTVSVIGVALVYAVLVLGCTSETQTVSGSVESTEVSAPNSNESRVVVSSDIQGSGSILLPPFNEGRISSNVYPNQQFGIWVTGSGSVAIEPDIAILNISIEALEDSVAQAQAKVNQAMSIVLGELRKARIPQNDLQTSHFRIQPNYVYEPVLIKGEPQYHLPQRQILVGYGVDQGLTIKVRFLDRLGDLIDNITKAGENLIRVDGIRFDIDDRNVYQIKARTLALEDATAKAKQIADVMGVVLGSVVYVADNTAEPLRSVAPMMKSYAEMDVGTSVLAGELDIQVSLQAVFDIATG